MTAHPPAQYNIFGGVEPARVERPAHRRREARPAGYAARPGTGPQGETCKSCGHCRARCLSKTYHKCGLMVAAWTHGRATDVLLRSPACSKWIPGEPHRSTIHIGGCND
jgi:hypothetical protein